ncbi:MAG TPA: CHAT domain-containing tetratricopeptide repeat protein [Blastocatellia bacterium]|nr:CHAT domain-containing tetratricopeptide repeat protein [Blastocatellia bacterium]
MSGNLADRLIKARNLDRFLRAHGGAQNWQTFAALKAEVDRLVSCDLNRAARLADHIERLAEQAADPVASGFAEASRARVLHFSGRYEEANSLYERALATLLDARLTSEAVTIMIHQVYALTQMGRYNDALALARAARRRLKPDEKIKLAQLETNIGTVYFRLDAYKRALKHYDAAGEIFEAAGDEAMLAFVNYSRSNIFTEMDRPDEAEAMLKRAAAEWERSGLKLLAAQALYNSAYLDFLRGNYKAALTSYYKARDRVWKLGSSLLVAWCDLEIGEILLALNAFDDARASAASARARFDDLGMPYESAKAAWVESLAAMGLERFEQARKNLTAAREVFRASGNTTFTAQTDYYLAELSLRRGEIDEAAVRADSAMRVFARQKLVTRTARSRLLAARAAYASGDGRKAARLARSTLKGVERTPEPAINYQCHHLIGRVHRDRGERSRAIARFRQAVETVEHMRGGVAADELKASFLRDKIGVYEDTITACLDYGTDSHVDEAFRLVESSKSRALADLLARYARTAPDTQAPAGGSRARGPKDETRARLAKLIQELNWYSSQVGLEDDKGHERSASTSDSYRRRARRRERQIAHLFRRIEIEDPRFANLHAPQSATVSDLRGALEAGETAIEYFTTGDEVSAFIATRDRIKVVRRIASKSELERRLAALRFQIEKFSYGAEYVDAHFWQLKGATDEALSEIYKTVFLPLESSLDNERLVIIPHDALHYVPFHALCDRRGYYLIDNFEISYAPSASVFALCRANNRSAPEGTLVALGISEKGTPAINDELETLKDLFHDAVILKGSRATRDNLIEFAPRARFLHLASHGYFRRDNPMFSFLKLADSQLNFYNLLDLKLNAEVVTLSACHTGINTVFPGDELQGLMRGFLYAGAPALIVSLWAVNDRSTAEFMGQLYSAIRAGDEKRRALRAAQLAIKEAYGHPYYWAPFVLIGNPG